MLSLGDLRWLLSSHVAFRGRRLFLSLPDHQLTASEHLGIHPPELHPILRVILDVEWMDEEGQVVLSLFFDWFVSENLELPKLPFHSGDQRGSTDGLTGVVSIFC